MIMRAGMATITSMIITTRTVTMIIITIMATITTIIITATARMITAPGSPACTCRA